MIDVVVKRIGLDAEVGDRFKANSRKVKFCIRGPLPADDIFPAKFNDFDVVHHYLQVWFVQSKKLDIFYTLYIKDSKFYFTKECLSYFRLAAKEYNHDCAVGEKKEDIRIHVQWDVQKKQDK